mgnify:CR=1 FL=1
MDKRKDYPCEEVCPEDFLTNDEVKELLDTKNEFKFQQEDGKKLLNCVHCNECETSEERISLNRKFLEDGNEIHNLDVMMENFREYGTPYESNEMRIKIPKKVPKSSDRLFFMGCLSTMRTPRYTQNALKYLLKRGIDFCVQETEVCCGYPLYVSGERELYTEMKDENVRIFKEGGYKEIICLCPACYYVFRKDYPDMGLKISYISDYLRASAEKKSGTVSVQHLCQLMNRGREEVDENVNLYLKESGYDVLNVPHWCCGGGIGYMHRTDVIDMIAEKRMGDFKGDYYTTYCPSCYWVLKVYRKHLQDRKKTKLRDIFSLLMP